MLLANRKRILLSGMKPKNYVVARDVKYLLLPDQPPDECLQFLL